MKPMRQPILSMVLVLSAFAFSGCISHETRVVRDVERKPVEFENESAGRVFYEALSKTSRNYSRSETTTEFELPIILDHKRHVVTGPNTAFNEAVAVCDSNKDGKITETEAAIFAAQVK